MNIVGLGKCIPKKKVDNQELYSKITNFDLEKAKSSFVKRGMDVSSASDAQLFDLWVQQISGIKSRAYVSEGEFERGLAVEDMAQRAAKEALAEAHLSPKDIDHIIFSTYSSDLLLPPAACKLSDFLEVNVAVRTINGACSGFLDGLIDAFIKVHSGFYQNVLVVASEQMSNKVNHSDPKSAVLFGDGAGACVVSSAKGKGPRNMRLLSFDGGVKYSEQVYMQRQSHILFQDGPYVQRNAVRTMHSVIESALKNAGKSFADLQGVVPHQANGRIVDALDEKLKSSVSAAISASVQQAQEKEQCPSFFTVNNIEHYGNLSSASVPVVLYDYVHGRLAQKACVYKPQQLIALASVGGGYTYSAVTLLS